MLLPRLRVKTLMGLVAVVALAMGALEYGFASSYGVGSTTVRTRFTVVDDEDSSPIPGAILDLLENDTENLTHPRTDGDGSHVREDHVLFTTITTWRDRSIAPRVPNVQFAASAPGYQTTPLVFLDSSQNRRAVKQSPSLSTLEVTIRLKKLPASESPQSNSVENVQP